MPLQQGMISATRWAASRTNVTHSDSAQPKASGRLPISGKSSLRELCHIAKPSGQSPSQEELSRTESNEDVEGQMAENPPQMWPPHKEMTASQGPSGITLPGGGNTIVFPRQLSWAINLRRPDRELKLDRTKEHKGSSFLLHILCVHSPKAAQRIP